MKKIFDRINKRPQFVGQTFKMKSRTIPGQDYTPQEIVRNFVQSGIKPAGIYLDADVSQFTRMDKMDKEEFIKNLTDFNSTKSAEVKKGIQALKDKVKTKPVSETPKTEET